jgi:hypothetical protein
MLGQRQENVRPGDIHPTTLFASDAGGLVSTLACRQKNLEDALQETGEGRYALLTPRLEHGNDRAMPCFHGAWAGAAGTIKIQNPLVEEGRTTSFQSFSMSQLLASHAPIVH